MNWVVGLAHFLEHMLFLGSKKFPVPDEYRNFLSQNSGFSNAYTGKSFALIYLF